MKLLVTFNGFYKAVVPERLNPLLRPRATIKHGTRIIPKTLYVHEPPERLHKFCIRTIGTSQPASLIFSFFAIRKRNFFQGSPHFFSYYACTAAHTGQECTLFIQNGHSPLWRAFPGNKKVQNQVHRIWF
jgi:hypothetical protein